MPLTLLEIAQEALVGTGITMPSALVAGDALGLQLLRIANTAGKDIAEKPWEILTTEATFVSVATETQLTIVDQWDDIRSIIPGTFWNRTALLPVKGPLSAQAWQRQKARGGTIGPLYFRIRGGDLLMAGSGLAAGDTYAFEYLSRNWVQNEAETDTFERFQADTDTPLFSDHALMLEIRWRFRYEKGLEYEEQMRDSREYLENSISKDTPPETLSMVPGGAAADNLEPWSIPEGDWYQ